MTKTVVVEVGADHEIRKADFRLGGLGRAFLRSRDILQLLYYQRQEEFDEQILRPLELVTKEMKPMEKMLSEAKAKFEETESEIFGSQIRPLEVKLKPLQEQRAVLEKDKLRGDKVMAAIKECLERSEELYMADGEADVLLVDLGKSIRVQAGRKIGLSCDSEISWVLTTSAQDGLSLQGKWKASKQTPEQPLVVDIHGLSTFTGGSKQGLVLSMAPPDEGVKKLCAVAEWRGPVNALDVTARLEQLLVKCHMDGLIPRKDQGLGPRLTSTATSVAMLRRNELWLPVKPPIGKDWLDHLVKVPAGGPAKNSTFYSLKDCPFTWYSPWGDLDFDSDLREKKYDAPKPRVDVTKTLDWQLGSNLMDANSFTCTVPSSKDHVLAVDMSASGEVSVSKLPLAPGGETADADANAFLRMYAVASLQVSTFPYPFPSLSPSPSPSSPSPPSPSPSPSPSPFLHSSLSLSRKARALSLYVNHILRTRVCALSVCKLYFTHARAHTHTQSLCAQG